MPATNTQPEAFSDAWFDAQDVDNVAEAELMAREAEFDRQFAAREAAQERAAYTAKMERDRALAAQDVPAMMARVQAQTSANLSATQPVGKLEPGEKKRSALFDGACKRCTARIHAGDTIAYIKGKGSRHFPACPAAPAPAQTVQAPRVRVISSGQVQLIADLQRERGVPVNALPDDTPFAEASQLISTLIQMPKISAGKRRIDLLGLPEGRYAVRTDTPDQHYAFYNVTERGVFLQLSDSLNAVPESVELAVISKILIDPAEAARAYGREIGDCGVCGRTLTNEVSRAYGIGPVCRKNTGW